jgi:predicted RNA-binding Zn ribbon-like protein
MCARSPDTDSKSESIQVGLLQQATIERRAAIAISLSETVIRLARRAIRQQNPRLDDREALLLFVSIHYGSELAEDLRRDLEKRLK